MICEHLANTKNIPKHPINTRKSCEHAYGVRKIPNLHLLIIISDFQSHFSAVFPLFRGKTPFWCSQVVFARCIILNISNTNKLLGVIITISFFLFNRLAYSLSPNDLLYAHLHGRVYPFSLIGQDRFG